MKIQVKNEKIEIMFQLNDSQASKELYEQLPLSLKVENFGGDEKIFYPPHSLSVKGAPKARARKGTLAYYEPWGDVVMFYQDFGTASGLYEMGFVTEGKEEIQNLSGTIEISRAEE